MRRHFIMVLVLIALTASGAGVACADETLQVEVPGTCQQSPGAALPEAGTAPDGLFGQPAPEPAVRCLPPSCGSDSYCVMWGLGTKCVQPSIFVCPHCE